MEKNKPKMEKNKLKTDHPSKTGEKTLRLAYTGILAALMAVCSWISIPAAVPFTLQTFGVFLAIGLLGGKQGTAAVLVYILLAAVGFPVLAGFRGGPGAIFGVTGGYLLGFLLCGLCMWAAEHFFGKRPLVFYLSGILGLLVCYLFGTLWYVFLYTGETSFAAVLSVCVIPFILPDLLKLWLAAFVSRRLGAALRR